MRDMETKRFTWNHHHRWRGIYITWMSEGWEPMMVDDFGNMFAVEKFLVRDRPHGMS